MIREGGKEGVGFFPGGEGEILDDGKLGAVQL